MNLDLGSGPHPYHPDGEEPYIGVDVNFGTVDLVLTTETDNPQWRKSIEDVNPGEVVCENLRVFPWTWCPDHVIERVWSSYYVQYQTGSDWVRFIDELWRILKPGGQARILCANLKTGRAFQDPLYLDWVPLERWSYASRRWRQNQGVPEGVGYSTGDLDIVSYGWEGLHDDVVVVPSPAEEVKAFVETLLEDWADGMYEDRFNQDWAAEQADRRRHEWAQLLAGSSVLVAGAGRHEDAKQQMSSHDWDFAADCWVMLRACCVPGEHAWKEQSEGWRECQVCATERKDGEPE